MENKNSIICIHKDTNCREMSTPFICISIVFNNDNQYLKILFRDLIKKSVHEFYNFKFPCRIFVRRNCFAIRFDGVTRQSLMEKFDVRGGSLKSDGQKNIIKGTELVYPVYRLE